MDTQTITIFTDGSSRGNPGPGGWGSIVIFRGEVTELGGREEHTTNNRMELQAVIGALDFVEKLEKADWSVTVCSDSAYVINGITKWIFGWQTNGWITKTKQEVENRDLWETLFERVAGKSIEWKKVGGHVGLSGNERCDEIATSFADGGRPDLYVGFLDKYGVKNVLNLYDISYKKVETKDVSRARQKAKAYSYVSAVSGKVMVHKTWVDCEARVKGAKGAKFKKVFSGEEELKLKSEWSKIE